MNHANSIESNPSLRVGLYARVSSQQQASDGTIDSQIEALRQRIAADGLSVEPEMCFIDDGYSGSTLVRPALEKLRDTADAGAVDRLYVLCPDRLARNYAYQVVLVDELRRCGVEILFLNQLNRELGSSPEGDLLLQVQGVVAQYERAQIMERSRRGKLHAARRGSVSVLTQAPYGYRYIPKYQSGADAALNIVLEHAAVVRQIFNWVGVDRLSLMEVCRRLRKQGTLSPSGKDYWNRGTVATILRNPAYMGQAAYGRRRSGEMRKRLRPCRNSSAQPRRPRGVYAVPPEQWVRFAVPALVDAQAFAAVAEQLEENRRRCRVRAGQRPRGLLSGLVVCGKCGYCLCACGVARKHHGYIYYRCIGRDGHRFGGKPVCDARAVRCDQLEQAVWADVCDLLRDPSRLAGEYQRRLQTDDADGLAQERQKLLEAIRKTRRAMARLIDAWSDGLLEKPDFESRLHAARRRLQQLQSQVQSQKQLQQTDAEMRLVIGSLEGFAAQVKEGLAAADFQARRDILCALVKRVELNDEQVSIIYRIDPDPRGPAPVRPVLQHCLSDAGAMPE